MTKYYHGELEKRVLLLETKEAKAEIKMDEIETLLDFKEDAEEKIESLTN